jgi:Tfp pilus assembly protein PilF
VAALQAPATVEDPFDAWYNLAQMSAARNDAAGAERGLRAAIAAKPQWFKPHWTLAQLLFLQGRGEEAKSEAALALQLDAGKHPEVQRTLTPILSGASFH